MVMPASISRVAHILNLAASFSFMSQNTVSQSHLTKTSKIAVFTVQSVLIKITIFKFSFSQSIFR